MSDAVSLDEKRQQRREARDVFWSDNDKSAYECPDCGRRRPHLRTGFEVHHKDGDTQNNDKENLIALCRSCHNLREGKKPSINEIELMQSQISDEIGNSGFTPLAESHEELDDIYKSDEKNMQPHMVLKQIRRRKYLTLEIDFTSARGWKTVETDDGEQYTEACPQLDKASVEAVNAIAKRYREKEKPANTISALSTSYDADFISFPPMLPEVSRQLAAELRPIIMNEQNWETRF